MPRGARAVHELSGLQARSEPLIGYWPVSTWLPVACTCEKRLVAALQRDVRECVPISCGHPRCVGIPAPVDLGPLSMARDRDPGFDVMPSGGGHYEEAGPRFDAKIDKLIAAQGDVLGRPAVRARAHVVTAASVQRDREEQDLTDRIGRGEVAWRRQDVAQLWRENLPVVTIAKRLGVRVTTVYNDVKVLAAHGRIPARPHGNTKQVRHQG